MRLGGDRVAPRFDPVVGMVRGAITAEKNQRHLARHVERRQQHAHDCGAAAFAILFKYWFPRRPLPDWGELADPEVGLGPDALELFVRKEFPHSHLRARLDLPGLRFHAARTPVLCLVTVAPGQDHWVVARGVTAHRVHVQCPSDGRVGYTHADWLVMWTDAASGGIYRRLAITGWPE